MGAKRELGFEDFLGKFEDVCVRSLLDSVNGHATFANAESYSSSEQKTLVAHGVADGHDLISGQSMVADELLQPRPLIVPVEVFNCTSVPVESSCDIVFSS